MSHLILVTMIDGVEQISEDLSHNRFLQGLSFRLLRYQIKQISSWAILHNNVQKVFVLIRFIVLNNIRMVQSRENVNFSLNLLQILTYFLLWNSFDCNFES